MTKVALCMTTINVPHVLKLYRACDADVEIFVAGDQKTPREAYELVLSMENTRVSLPESGHQWKCSELIGFGSIQRRNIAFLEALKWGAEIVVSIDDDNLPLASPYCHWHQLNIRRPFSGVMVSNVNHADNWFDVGSLLQPQAKHRGIPHQVRPKNSFDQAVHAEVAVSAGICLGDPDIDATTRIAAAPSVHQFSRLLEDGIVCNPHTWTVFNSQNTAIDAALIPAWGMIPFVGRFDDIYASLIAQRVMRERKWHVHFGKPYVIQERNQHDLVKDLRGEVDGYDNVLRLAELLDHVVLTGKSVIDDTRRIWETLNHASWMPGRSVSAMMAYIDDCESVLQKTKEVA